MEKKSWKVASGGTIYAVDLLWSYWGGHREVQVDGQTVERSTIPMRWRSRQSFELADGEAVVETRPAKSISPYFSISLGFNGDEIASDSPLSFWER